MKSSRLLLVVLVLGAFLLTEKVAARGIPDPFRQHHIPFGKDYPVVEPVAKFGGRIVGYPLAGVGYATGRFLVGPVLSFTGISERDAATFIGGYGGAMFGSGIGQWLFGAPTFAVRIVFVDLPWYLVSAEKRAKDRISLSGPGVDKKLRELGDKQYLKTLDLQHSDVTDEGLRHLKSMESLEVLNLHHTDITGTGFKDLKNLENLRVIYMNNTNLTDKGIEHLKSLKNLRTLYLRNTDVTDDGINELKESLPDVRVYR